MNGNVRFVFGDVEPATLRRVLLVRLDNLGDVLLTTPAFRAVRRALPEAHLALLAGPAGLEAGGLNSAFDAAIIFTSYKQSALPAAYLCYLAGIPLRAAGSFEGPGSLLTHRHRYEETVPPKHETLRGLELTKLLGFPPVEPEMVLVPREEEEEGAAKLLERHGIGREADFAVVHPGASASSRAYPPERYAAVVEELTGQGGLPVLVTGGSGEEDLTRRVEIGRAHG